MLLHFLWFFIISAVLGKSVTIEKIINGKDASIEQYPYQIALLYKGKLICGGSIISKNYVITAAHCVDNFKVKNFRVSVGSAHCLKGIKYKLYEIKIHPNYNKNAILNDIAIIKLKKSLEFSKNIKPIKLQPIYTEVPDGTEAYISGWGVLRPYDHRASERLQAATVSVISNEKCRMLMSKFGFEITYESLCAIDDSQGACIGDSGGPIIANNTLIGVVSWGLSNCDPPNPGVFTNMSYVRDFIDNYV